uniref:hypothetical protein n=1 Tax=Bilophila wadsworthia TaxID=35833 RepID=UPI003FF0E8DE
MTAKEIYFKTMRFNWLKLALGFAMILASLVLLALCLGLGWLFGTEGMGVMFLVWLGGTGVIRFVVMHYCGYMLKAGHVAIIAEAVTTGHVPDDQIDTARRMVAERFAASNVYFAVDKLVDGAIRQLQAVLERAGSFLSGVPGFDAVMKIVRLFLSIALGYVDECCLGYTFHKKDQNTFKSAADGVVIYYQNWKFLLKNAALTTAFVVGAIIAVTIVVFLIIGGLFVTLGWDRHVAFFLAVFVAFAVKFAFIDSWILVNMMTSYMQVAPATEIPFDLYGQLCACSAKFRELYEQGCREVRESMKGEAPAAPGTPPVPEPAPASASPASTAVSGAEIPFTAEAASETGPSIRSEKTL